jgi:hypothetical protein
VATRRLGPIQRRSARVFEDLPRELLQFAIDLFSPVAELAREEGGRALLTVRGASLAAASPAGRVVQPGTVFIPLRLTTARDGTPIVLKVPYTYLKVESVDGALARCGFITNLSDPLSKRWPRPYTFGAIGIKPGTTPLRLRFVTRKTRDQPEEEPAAGYLLTARDAPDGVARDVGTTDRSGRIVVKSSSLHGLSILRLLGGSVEPLFEFPAMPGESTEERVIAVDVKPLAVALETQLDSMRDEVVDLVARRARLAARMKARLDGEDWPGLAATLQEYAKLPPREQFVDQLKSIRDQATRQQAESRRAILTRTAQAQLNDLQALIDRYLDDEEFKAFSEALEQSKANTETAKARPGESAKRSTAGAELKAPPADGNDRPASSATEKPEPAPSPGR